MSTITKNWLDDIRGAVAFLTRVPMPHPHGARPGNFARAHRAFPLVGAAIGAVVGLAYLGLTAIGLPTLASAAIALGISAVLTGALHEDGLADLADGFGGGRDKAAKLEIMRDSRLGTYGALILLITFFAKLSAVAVLPKVMVLPSLVAAHALARAPLSVMAMTMPYARHEGLAVTAGRPDPTTVWTAVLFALAVAFLALPWIEALGAALVAAVAAACIAILAQRQIGGQTGDVLGAAEQVAETGILLLLATRLAQGSA
jgi:adenosylcobinamide-GDP ribazoletransferase